MQRRILIGNPFQDKQFLIPVSWFSNNFELLQTFKALDEDFTHAVFKCHGVKLENIVYADPCAFRYSKDQSDSC